MKTLGFGRYKEYIYTYTIYEVWQKYIVILTNEKLPHQAGNS